MNSADRAIANARAAGTGRVEADILTAADGTAFAIQSEHVRGEPRAYWLIRRDPGASSFVRDGHANYDEVYRKDAALRQLRRRVREYDAVCAALGRDARGAR